MLEEHDYNDDIKDPFLILKHQKYKTWLYVLLLTKDIYKKLSIEHDETLSCPCKTITIPYKNFVFNNITIHPVCLSDFIEKQWIEGLYFINASLYTIWDFRKTAFSQFQLLSIFCSFSKEIIFQIEKDVNLIDLITIELLSERQIQLEINGIIEFEKNNAFGQIKSFLDYLKATICYTL